MQGAVEMVAGVVVPLLITTRHEDKKLPLTRTPDPQGQPKIRPLVDGHGVAMFTGDRLKPHQPELWIGSAAPSCVVKKPSPHRQVLGRCRCRVHALITPPPLER